MGHSGAATRTAPERDMAFVETMHKKVDILDGQGRLLLGLILKDAAGYGDHAIVRRSSRPRTRSRTVICAHSPRGGHRG